MFRVYCQECDGDLEPVDWLPEEGLDPGLRKLKCSRCGQEEFQVLIVDEQRRFKLKLLEKAKSKKVGG